jgi:hypothetical protein
MSTIFFILRFEDLLVPERPFQKGVHLHVPELRDNKVQVGDGFQHFLRILLQEQLRQVKAAESQLRPELHLCADLDGFLVVPAGFSI